MRANQALSAAALCLVPLAAARAAIDLNISLLSQGSLVTPTQASTAVLYDCSVDLPGVFGQAGFSLNLAGSGNGNFNVSLQASIPTTPADFIQEALDNQISNILPDLPCSFGVEQNLGLISGNINLYSLAAGGGFSGGFVVTRRALARATWNDIIEISSQSVAIVELPLHISGSITVAESFGDPNATRAYGKLRLTGTLGGQAFDEVIEAESQSVFPPDASINVNRVITLTLTPGINSVSVNCTSEAEGVATAVSAGLFGTIVGAATTGVSFPNSIRIGRFTGVGGGPLPAGITIRSAQTGLLYQPSTASTCPGDLTNDNRVSEADLGILLAAWQTNAAGDLNGDNQTDEADLGIMLGNWQNTCP